MNATVSPNIAADVPSLSISLLFTSVAFEIAGASMLALGAPPLATLHAFAAFIVLAVVAGTHQLLPVLFRSTPLPLATTLLAGAGFAAGFALLIAGFCGLPTFVPAALMIGLAAATWVATVTVRVLRASSERRTAAAIGAALGAFTVAGACGVYMATRIAAGAAVFGFVPALHGSLMVLSFASMLIVALSYRFVPMFALSHATAYGKRISQFVLSAVMLAIAVGVHNRIAFASAALAFIVIGAQHVQTLRTRVRRRLDVSLHFAAVAWLLATVALVLLSITNDSAIVAGMLTIAVLGWITLTIFGYTLKIAGFLSWQYARNKDELRMLRPLSTAIPNIHATITLMMLAIGAICIALAPAVMPNLAKAAALVYLCGSISYGALLIRVVHPYLAAVPS